MARTPLVVLAATVLLAATTSAYSTTTDTASTLTPEGQTKQIIRELMASCPDDCIDVGLRVLNSYGTQDICRAVYEYRSCTYRPCQSAPGFEEYFTIGMCGVTKSAYRTTTYTTTALTSEGHIQQIILGLMNRCPNHCADPGRNVVARTDKEDICQAVRSYKGCTFLFCISVSTSYELSHALDICEEGNSCGHDKVSMLVLLLAIVMVHIFK
ncbi:unnamed protein product [Lymnaea stagnalis]|uniref:Uncharacterized protein n=1 Tax=Lymnaea stagnalis TaxID=6523 RepID=A0AAV2IHR0_LYMST